MIKNNNAFIDNVLAQIEAEYSPDTLIFSYYEVSKLDTAFITFLCDKKLLHKRKAEYVDCIACDNKAEIQQSNKKLLGHNRKILVLKS